MWQAVQLLLLLAYLILPAAMLLWALHKFRRHGSLWPLASFFLACLAGAAIGVALLLLNRWLMEGRVAAAEGLRLIYLAVSALCLIKLVDYGLLRAAFRLARMPFDSLGRPATMNRGRAIAALTGQRLLMLALIIPYVLALVLTYRPKVMLPGDPATQLGVNYHRADFVASDGIHLAGWFIPALPQDSAEYDEDAPEQWGSDTVIICHGVGSGKERQLDLAHLLASRGYNILLFDFRAHGESGGNFVTFGDRERLDVLAAVQWAQINHPQQAQRILGIGINTGAAALLAAAADSGSGDLIDALILYEPFARFDTLAGQTSQRLLPGALSWLFNNVALPLASLHAGSDLRSFAPIELADRIWPRPLLIIHGRGDTFIPVTEEMDLYRESPFPKAQFWPADNYTASRRHFPVATGTEAEARLLSNMFRQFIGTLDSISADGGVQYQTLRFLRHATRLPVI